LVEALAPDGYEVEFADTNGVPYRILAVRAEQMMILHHEPTKV